jgi:hypothetical protein
MGVTKVFFKGETMRKLILILLAATLSVSVACSKKKSSSPVATAPTTPTTPVDPNTPSGGVIIGLPAPVNGKFYYGTVQISKRSTYVNFLRSAFGYQYYNQNSNDQGYGNNQGYSYNYSYSCDINLFRWLFDDNLIDCGGGQTQYNDYVSDLSYEKTMVQFLFKSDGSVKGLWLAGASQDLQGNFYAYEQIPFYGNVVKLQDGRYLIEAGPLAFVTTSSLMNFDVHFEDVKFGNTTIR